MEAELTHGSKEHSLHPVLLLSDSFFALGSSSVQLRVVNRIMCKFTAMQ